MSLGQQWEGSRMLTFGVEEVDDIAIVLKKVDFFDPWDGVHA